MSSIKVKIKSVLTVDLSLSSEFIHMYHSKGQLPFTELPLCEHSYSSIFRVISARKTVLLEFP